MRAECWLNRWQWRLVQPRNEVGLRKQSEEHGQFQEGGDVCAQQHHSERAHQDKEIVKVPCSERNWRRSPKRYSLAESAQNTNRSIKVSANHLSKCLIYGQYLITMFHEIHPSEAREIIDKIWHNIDDPLLKQKVQDPIHLNEQGQKDVVTQTH
jgi:hypothetical protein